MRRSRFLRFAAPELLRDPEGHGPGPGRADTLFLLGFYAEENWGAWGWGARERWKTDREVMGKMTLTPGIWRQVAEEEAGQQHQKGRSVGGSGVSLRERARGVRLANNSSFIL